MDSKNMLTYLQHLYGKQLRLPMGLLGKIIGKLMNKCNAAMYESTIDLMPLKTSNHVLEIGFGGGDSLYHLLKRLPDGKVMAVDISPTMVSQARRRFHCEIACEKLEVAVADVIDLPYSDNIFDNVCAINNLYFWSNLSLALHEIKRVLKTEGKLYLTFRVQNDMKARKYTQDNFLLYELTDIEQELDSAGFDGLIVHKIVKSGRPFVCLIAQKK